MNDETPKSERPPRRAIVGIVTSTKMQKTIVVRFERTVQHPVFKKYVRRSTVYKAHDEDRVAEVGDRVLLMETRPISKTKCFRLVRVIHRARVPASVPEVRGDVAADAVIEAGEGAGAEV
jgi:small subunit ribosomal protein S17